MPVAFEVFRSALSRSFSRCSFSSSYEFLVICSCRDSIFSERCSSSNFLRIETMDLPLGFLFFVLEVFVALLVLHKFESLLQLAHLGLHVFLLLIQLLLELG